MHERYEKFWRFHLPCSNIWILMDAGLALLGMHWYKPAEWEIRGMKTNYCFNFHKALPAHFLCPHAASNNNKFLSLWAVIKIITWNMAASEREDMFSGRKRELKVNAYLNHLGWLFVLEVDWWWELPSLSLTKSHREVSRN